MDVALTRIDTGKLRRQLRRVQLAVFAAMELGDCRAVAKLTCEAARLVDAIKLARVVCLEAA